MFENIVNALLTPLCKHHYERNYIITEDPEQMPSPHHSVPRLDKLDTSVNKL